MSTLSRCVLTLALALGALLAACGGGGGAATPSPGPGPTSTPTAEPSAASSPTATGVPSPTAEPQDAPHAPAPEVPDNVTVLALGEMSLNIGAGDTYAFDPIDLGTQQGVEVPPCAAFVFLFGWQVRDPYPPEYVNLRIRWTRTGSMETIAEDASGTQSIGCGGIEVVNDSAAQVTVEVRYGIGELQG